MKNQKGISMITLIITIVVIIILAAIAIVASGDTVNSAQFSTFASEFGDYAVNFKTDPYAEVEEKMGLQGKSMTEAQKYFLAARDTNPDTPIDLTGIIIPAGVSFAGNTIATLKNAADQDVTTQYWGSEKLTSDETVATGEQPSDDTIACYQIADSQISGYKDGHEFYGKNLGAETHWVTEKGFVFTLPGYPREVDGQFRMYIAPEVYYVAADNFEDVINSNEFVEVAPHQAEGATAVTTATSITSVGVNHEA